MTILAGGGFGWVALAGWLWLGGCGWVAVDGGLCLVGFRWVAVSRICRCSNITNIGGSVPIVYFFHRLKLIDFFN